MIRRLAAAAVLGLAGAAATPAIACVPEAPPLWGAILRENGPAVFLGRVVQIKLEEPPQRGGGWEVHSATAWIRPVELVQGEFNGEARITGAVVVKRTDPAAEMYCGDFLRHEIGDRVLVVARADGTHRTFTERDVGEPNLQRLFERHR